jgi:Leucine-rich repeat (LRR) protein
VECQNKQWFTVPSLDKLLDSQDQSHMSVNKLELKNGALNFLNQDAFKNQQIQILALGQNNIQNVNVNAFRGLEGTLKGLDLQNNDLNLIPIWSLTFLENLQYLHLQGNQIGSLDPNTTVETKLNQLHYLYLDRNKLTKIESGSLAKFPLLVLTLSKNQIADLEKDSLPTSLNILDLSNNLIESVSCFTL